MPRTPAYKKANLAKAREKRKILKAYSRPVQGFLPALTSPEPGERVLHE